MLGIEYWLQANVNMLNILIIECATCICSWTCLDNTYDVGKCIKLHRTTWNKQRIISDTVCVANASKPFHKLVVTERDVNNGRETYIRWIRNALEMLVSHFVNVKTRANLETLVRTNMYDCKCDERHLEKNLLHT